MGAGFQEGLLESVTNPVAGVFAGILATVLVQSSSVSTSTIVGMVGAGTLGVAAAVPMVMGANIGTSVTNTLASLGHIRRRDEFRRAFAGATVHDFLNLLSVALLLPLELATGVLSRSAQYLADVLADLGLEGGEANSFIKEAVDLPVDAMGSLVEGIAGSGTALGVVLIGLGLVAIFTALASITRNMRQLVAGRVEAAINRIVGRGGGLVAIVIGLAVTVAVQSSSITTSILVPLVAAGILTLDNAYPITLGANVGTTVTALIASLAVDLQAGLVVALVHTLFNVAGILIFSPVPVLRRVPLRLAQGLADVSVDRGSLVAAYIVGAFVVVRSLVSCSCSEEDPMVLKFFRTSADVKLERVEATLLQMLQDDRHSFDAAVSALIGGAAVDVVGPDLRETDRRVNDAERAIRRELLVHASVRHNPDIPAILTYMSIVKDAERIGDYAKNIFDLADEGVDFSAAPDRDELVATRDRVSTLIGEVVRVFSEQDTDRARELIEEGDQLQDAFDDTVAALVTSDSPSSYGVPRALFHRHCKRIVAHSMNMLSALVMPLDQLDYFDEDHETR